MPQSITESSLACRIEGCQRPVAYSGHRLCNAHYLRLRRFGDPLGSGKKSLMTRFMEKVVKRPNGCWEWTAYRDANGYGKFYVGGDDKHPRFAHRVAYQLFRGPIPSGKVIDHLCRNRWCCNPEHLDAVTQETNILRGEAPSVVAGREGRCIRGHEVTPENTYYTKHGYPHCRICRRERRAQSGHAGG